VKKFIVISLLVLITGIIGVNGWALSFTFNGKITEADGPAPMKIGDNVNGIFGYIYKSTSQGGAAQIYFTVHSGNFVMKNIYPTLVGTEDVWVNEVWSEIKRNEIILREENSDLTRIGSGDWTETFMQGASFDFKNTHGSNIFSDFKNMPMTLPIKLFNYISISGYNDAISINPDNVFNWSASIDPRSIKILGGPLAPVPEPTTMLLLGSGLLGLTGFRKKLKR
jgi:hypothetical protein